MESLFGGIMKLSALARALVPGTLAVALVSASFVQGSSASAQSGRQPEKKKVEKKTDVQKGQQQTPQEPLPPVPKDLKDQVPIKLGTQVVNVETSVNDKKTGKVYTNLTQKDFTIYEDNVKQEITNFSPGEGPMTAVLLLENNYANHRWQGWFNPTFAQEVFQSAAVFTQRFVKQQDNVALVTYSMRPKVIQDFTNDGNRLYQAVLAAYRDTLNFSEACIYDALAFVLRGGKAIQLFEEQRGEGEYTGLEEVEGHTAVILVTLGFDTFSRLNRDEAFKVVTSAGVPIFTVHVGNLFEKKYGGGVEFAMARLTLQEFAKRTGGAYLPMTFESEIPGIMRTIEVLLRTQYSIGYAPTNTRRDGKERKIKVEVDVDGDGVPDNKRLELRHRLTYFEPDDKPKKK
jgi:VWFA-related protein